jgi:hypothetical protein
MSILNINNGGGGGSYIRFMPSANAWVFNKEEVSLDVLVLDHDSVKTGWGKMADGQPPEWQWDQRLGVDGGIPSQERDVKGNLYWKRGFSISFYTKATGTVEWSSTGTGPVIGFDQIFEEIWNAKEANPGKVAVVKYTGSTALKVGKGNTRVPNFVLGKWVAKDSVPWATPEEEAPAPKPAPKAAPKPATAELDDDMSF